MENVNLWAIVAAAVANIVVGSIWYSQAVFGREWLKLSGISEEKMREMSKKGMKQSYLGGFVAALVVAYVLARFLALAGATGASAAATVAFWIWLGFVATVLLGNVLWEGKPVKLYLINAGHYLVSLVVMAVVLALW